MCVFRKGVRECKHLNCHQVSNCHQVTFLTHTDTDPSAEGRGPLGTECLSPEGKLTALLCRYCLVTHLHSHWDSALIDNSWCHLTSGDWSLLHCVVTHLHSHWDSALIDNSRCHLTSGDWSLLYCVVTHLHSHSELPTTTFWP